MAPFERNAVKGDSVRPISKIISLIKVRWKLRMEFFRWFRESESQPSLSAFIHSAPLPLIPLSTSLTSPFLGSGPGRGPLTGLQTTPACLKSSELTSNLSNCSSDPFDRQSYPSD